MYIAKGLVPCRVNDPDLWTAEREDTRRTLTAKALCKTCPERMECWASTKRFEQRTGMVQPVVLAGFARSERIKIYARKRARSAAWSA